jgi:chaperone LolA
MRLLLLLVLLLLLSPDAAQAQKLPDAEAQAYLQKLAATRSGDAVTQVSFRETRTSPLLQAPVTTEGTLEFQPPDRFRRETTGRNGSVMVSDGTTFWIYYPTFQEAEKYSVKAGGGAAAAAMNALVAAFQARDLDKFFRCEVAREGDSHRVTLEPRRRNERKFLSSITLLVGPDQKLRHAAWMTPDGERTEVDFFGERTVARGDFEFQPPNGTHVNTPLGR